MKVDFQMSGVTSTDGTGGGASICAPRGLAVDSRDNLYVAESDSIGVPGLVGYKYIRRVTPEGVTSKFASSEHVRALAIDPISGSLAVTSERDTVSLVSPSGGVSNRLAGQSNGFLDATGTNAKFNYPSGVVFDASGNVVVADSRNNCIRKVTTSGGVVTTFAGSTSGGFADMVGTNAKFAHPNGIAVDSKGNLIVADGYNSRIRKVAPDGAVSTLAGSGIDGYGDGAAATAMFTFPIGVAVGRNDSVYVVDQFSHRVRVIFNFTCPQGFYCPDASSHSPPTPCPVGSFCPAGSSAPFPCPAGTPGLLLSAASLSACSISGGGATATAAFAAGSPCSSNSSCPSGACLGGYCCSSTAARQGCASCTPPFGDCRLLSPGEPCASNADCGTNLCAGGCCCSSAALLTAGCSSCGCWSAPGATAAAAGACNSTPARPPAAALPLPCNASTSLNVSVALSRVIAFPPSANVSGGGAPLVFLPAASPLNGHGVDIIVASPSACAAFAAAAAAAQCGAVAYALPGAAGAAPYLYLGAAAALGMVATPSCGA